MCTAGRPAAGPILFFFFNDTATTEIYTLSLHDALPIYGGDGRHVLLRQPDLRLVRDRHHPRGRRRCRRLAHGPAGVALDRKSTRLNSSHANIPYAVFWLNKKNPNNMRRFPMDSNILRAS